MVSLSRLFVEVRTYDLKKPKSVRWGNPKPQKAKAEENRNGDLPPKHKTSKPK